MERQVLWTTEADGTELAVVDGLSVEECRKVQAALRKLAEYERAEADERLFLLPVPIGGTVYEQYGSNPFTVIGYRLGRMAAEDIEEYADEHSGSGLWIEYEGPHVSNECAVCGYGRDFFRTREEALAKS